MSGAGRQRVWITGGSSGIGLALARHYALAGADVLLLARDAGRLEEAVEACRKQRIEGSQKFAGESFDIGDLEQLPVVLNRLCVQYGTPDLLVLCAGAAANATFMDTPAAVFDDLMRINFSGSREVIRGLLPAMRQRGTGQIAMISSIAGLTGIFGYGAYSASKFAVTGLAQVLRQELAGSGISVHLVCPPEFDTPMIAAESVAAVPQTRFLKDLVGTLPPDLAAKRIIRGISRKQAVIVPGYRASAMAWIARVCPGLFAVSCTALLRWRSG